MPIWSPEEGKSLVERGAISQQTYDSVFPPAPVVPDLMAQDPMQMPAAPAPAEVTPGPWGVQQRALEKMQPSTPDTSIDYDAMGARDQDMTNAYAANYGGQTKDQQTATPAQQQQPVVEQTSHNVEQPLTPAIPAGMAQNAAALPVNPMLSPLDQQQAAAMEMGRAGERKAQDEAKYHEQMEKDLNAKAAANLMQDQKDKEKLDMEHADLQRRADELTTKQIEPERYWNNKSTGEKILASIALGLGGATQARGGGNPALDMMTSAINRDIDAQKAAINSTKDQYNAKAGLYREMYDRYKDDRVARSAAMVQYMTIAENQLKAIGSRYGGAAAKAQANMLSSQIGEKKAVYTQQFNESLRKRMALDRMLGGGEFNPAALDKEDRERAVGAGKSFYGLANNETGANRIKAKLGDVESGIDSLDELIKMAKTGRVGKMSPEFQSKVSTLLGAVKGKLRTSITGPGAASDTEWKKIDEVIKDPSKIFSLGNEGSALSIIKKMTLNAWDRELNGEGLARPAERLRERFDEKPYTPGKGK